MKFSVYILECSDGSFYVGHTDDMRKRIAEHNVVAFQYCWTASRRPVQLVFQQLMPSRNEAFQAERQIKGWSRSKKRALIEGKWQDISTFAKTYNTRSSTPTGRPSTSSG